MLDEATVIILFVAAGIGGALNEVERDELLAIERRPERAPRVRYGAAAPAEACNVIPKELLP